MERISWLVYWFLLCQILLGSVAAPYLSIWASQVALVVKTPSTNAGDKRDMGSVHVSGRSPGGRHGHPLQYSCLEDPMDRGASKATVHSVAKSQRQLKWLGTHEQHNTSVGTTILRLHGSKEFLVQNERELFECASTVPQDTSKLWNARAFRNAILGGTW